MVADPPVDQPDVATSEFGEGWEIEEEDKEEWEACGSKDSSRMFRLAKRPRCQRRSRMNSIGTLEFTTGTGKDAENPVISTTDVGGHFFPRILVSSLPEAESKDRVRRRGLCMWNVLGDSRDFSPDLGCDVRNARYFARLYMMKGAKIMSPTWVSRCGGVCHTLPRKLPCRCVIRVVPGYSVTYCPITCY